MTATDPTIGDPAMLPDDADLMIGLYAYETGCVDSGIHDPVRREALFARLDALSDDARRVWLGRLVREHCVSEEALAAGYGAEDAGSFWDWYEDSGSYRP